MRWHHFLFSKKTESLFVLLFSCCTVVLFFWAYNDLTQSRALWQHMNYERAILFSLKENKNLTPVVTSVTPGPQRTDFVIRGITGVRCYESLFGYSGERHITSLEPGFVFMESNGFFNLNNPACFQYPEENNCKPGDRISISDAQNFERFRRGEKTTWKLSGMQIVSDWTSLVAFAGSMGVLCTGGILRIRRKCT